MNILDQISQDDEAKMRKFHVGGGQPWWRTHKPRVRVKAWTVPHVKVILRCMNGDIIDQAWVPHV